jgi:polar amino acid transport system substrate-binding protein
MKRLRKFTRGIFFTGLLLVSAASTHAAESVLSLSYNSDWPPYSSGLGEEVHGILPTLMEEIIAGRMDMAVTHHGSPWARAQHYVESGQLDAMITVPTDTRKAYANTTDQVVYTFEMRPIVKKDSDPESMLIDQPDVDTLKGLRVCDLLKNGWAERFYGENAITYYSAPDAVSCLRLINGGRMDVMVQPASIGFKAIAEEKLQDKLTTLDHVYGVMKFNILLSKQSGFDNDFLDRFDATIQAMIADGSYEALVNKLQSSVLTGEQ